MVSYPMAKHSYATFRFSIFATKTNSWAKPFRQAWSGRPFVFRDEWPFSPYTVLYTPLRSLPWTSITARWLNVIFGVNDGTRTHDNQTHNLAFCQLNYAHHIGQFISGVQHISFSTVLSSHPQVVRYKLQITLHGG